MDQDAEADAQQTYADATSAAGRAWNLTYGLGGVQWVDTVSQAGSIAQTAAAQAAATQAVAQATADNQYGASLASAGGLDVVGRGCRRRRDGAAGRRFGRHAWL